MWSRLFSHAEPGENAGDDLLPGGAARQLSQGVQGLLHVGEDGVGGEARRQGLPGPLYRLGGPAGGVLLALIGEDGSLGDIPLRKQRRHRLLQGVQPCAGEGAQAHRRPGGGESFRQGGDPGLTGEEVALLTGEDGGYVIKFRAVELAERFKAWLESR